MTLFLSGNNFANCTLPPGAAPPDNASCYQLCGPRPASCAPIASIDLELGTCLILCPPLDCALPPPSSDAQCVTGVWYVYRPLTINGTISVSTSPIVIDGNLTLTDTSITVITLSGAADGRPRINATGTLRLT